MVLQSLAVRRDHGFERGHLFPARNQKVLEVIGGGVRMGLWGVVTLVLRRDRLGGHRVDGRVMVPAMGRRPMRRERVRVETRVRRCLRMVMMMDATCTVVAVVFPSEMRGNPQAAGREQDQQERRGEARMAAEKHHSKPGSPKFSIRSE